MTTKRENEILAVVANDVKHLIDEVGEVKAKVIEVNGGLRDTQKDVAVMQSQNRQHCKCIEDLYAKYAQANRSIAAFLGIGAAIGAVVAGVMGFVAWMAGLL